MDAIVVRLILCGVVICSFLGCSAINQLTDAPRSGPNVVEEDVTEEVKEPAPVPSSRVPDVSDQPPAPAVEQQWPTVPPGERPPRHIKWQGDGWSPGDPKKDGTRP